MNTNLIPFVMVIYLAIQVHGMSVVSLYKFRPMFQFEGPTRISKDTLSIHIKSLEASNSFFYPFGEFSKWDELKNNLFEKKAVIQNRKEINGVLANWVILGNDSIRFIYKVRAISPKWELSELRISSGSVSFKNGIKIGVSKMEVFQRYFSEVPRNEYHSCKVLEIISGPFDDNGLLSKKSIRHRYKFHGSRLAGIQIIPGYSNGL